MGDYTEKKARTGEAIHSKKRVYLHLYFNPQCCVDEQLSFTYRLMHLQQELQTGKRVACHEKEYARYFICHEMPKRGLSVIPKEEAIRERKKDFGYFALLSDGVKDPVSVTKFTGTRTSSRSPLAI